MSDPKTDTKTDKVVIPPKVTPASAAKNQTVDASTMSSVGAELHPDAETKTIEGKLTLDAGGSHLAAAPQPTPAEAVLYPSTGGLPDTGPNSKYVLGEDTRPALYNADGDLVDADGYPIDDFGARIPDKGPFMPERIVDKNRQKQDEFVSAATKAEMDAGKRALSNR